MSFFEVTVGCKRFFFSTEEAMLAEIKNYIRDPDTVESLYRTFEKMYDEKAAEPTSTIALERGSLNRF